MAKAADGLSLVYLPANQAYLVMWLGQRLAGPIPKSEAKSLVDSIRSL